MRLFVAIMLMLAMFTVVSAPAFATWQQGGVTACDD